MEVLCVTIFFDIIFGSGAIVGENVGDVLGDFVGVELGE